MSVSSVNPPGLRPILGTVAGAVKLKFHQDWEREEILTLLTASFKEKPAGKEDERVGEYMVQETK